MALPRRISGAHACTPQRHRQVIEMVREGTLVVGKYVSRIMPLSRIEEAFAAIRDEWLLKVIVVPD
jgi:threonine dehydrogenase-like Zn-dependent dehydrogenase